MSLERGHGLTRDLAHTRPADILIAGWDRGKQVALDLTITSPLCSAILSESCHQAGVAALAAEVRKIHSNGPKCQGQAGPRYLLQAGVLPGHSPVLPQAISSGRDLWPVEYGSFHHQSHPGQGAPPLQVLFLEPVYVSF